MSAARPGDTVRVHYTGKLDDGSVFDSSRDNAPLEFTVGEGHVIAGFDAAVTGMRPGEEKQVTIPCDDAYGPRRADLVISVERSRLPDELEPRVGQQLQMKQDGNAFAVTVQAVSDESVALDLNHPLAGENLTFDLELVDIR